MNHNVRAWQIWAIISSQAKFTKRRVVDLGFGHGDLLACAAGVEATVTGIDRDQDLCRAAAERLEVLGGGFMLLNTGSVIPGTSFFSST